MSMTQMQTRKEQMKDSIEEMAEQLVMADLSDSSVFQRIAEKLKGISQALKMHFPRCSEAALAAGDLLNKGIRSRQGLSESDLAIVEKTISSLQNLINTDLEDHHIDFPDSFRLQKALPETEGKKGENGFTNCAAIVPADQEIRSEYIAHQEAVASEIEDLVLTYEKDPDAQILKELKRILHTAKGEAGVLGLNRIENVCHRVEDYIQDKESSLRRTFFWNSKTGSNKV